MKKILRSCRGDGAIDAVVVFLIVMLCLALITSVTPAFTRKQQLDVFAAELCRQAELTGQIGSETNARYEELRSSTGLAPSVSWSKSGRIQLNEEVTLTLTDTVDIGFFTFGSFPITLTARASGKSEVYWK